MKDDKAPNQDFIDQLIASWKKIWPEANLEGTELTGRIVRFDSFIAKEVDANLAKYNLNVGEFDVLAALKRAENHQLTPGRLQEQILISSGGLTNRINRLEARDLIVRLPDPSDRRVVIVFLTKKGHELIDQVAPTHFEVEKKLVEILTSKEREQLTTIMRKLLSFKEKNL